MKDITFLSASRRLIVILLLILAGRAAFSQQTGPCIPDCPQTPFTGPSFFAFIPAPAPWQSCLMRVEYLKRKACGIWDDIQVVSITFPGGPCQALRTWLGTSVGVSPAARGQFMSQAQNVASVGVITQEFNNMYNNASAAERDALDCPSRTSIWRAVKGSCWFIDSHNCYNDWTMRSCPNSACCLHEFTLCMGEDGPQATLTATIAPSTPCGNPVNPGMCAYWAADGRCYFTCDNDGIEDVIEGKASQTGSPDLSHSSTNAPTE